MFPKQFHITDDRKPVVHPDRWKWEYAISYIGMEWCYAALRRSGYRGKISNYYRQYRFAMNTKTSGDIDTEKTNDKEKAGVWYVTGRVGLTVGIYGIEIRIDDNLPDGRVALIKGDRCVSFDWRGLVRYEELEGE